MGCEIIVGDAKFHRLHIFRDRHLIFAAARVERSRNLRPFHPAFGASEPNQALSYDSNRPVGLAFTYKRDFQIPLHHQPFELLSPLDQQDAVL